MEARWETERKRCSAREVWNADRSYAPRMSERWCWCSISCCCTSALSRSTSSARSLPDDLTRPSRHRRVDLERATTRQFDGKDCIQDRWGTSRQHDNTAASPARVYTYFSGFSALEKRFQNMSFNSGLGPSCPCSIRKGHFGCSRLCSNLPARRSERAGGRKGIAMRRRRTLDHPRDSKRRTSRHMTNRPCSRPTPCAASG